MRVLIVSSNFPPNGWGGAEVAADGIGRWLVGEGHKVAIYTDSERPPANAKGQWSDYRWYAPRKHAWSHRTHEHAGKSAPQKALWHLRDHVPGSGMRDFGETAEDFRPDIVMVHLVPGLGVGIFEYCAERDIPVLYVLHDFWLTCLRSSMFSKAGVVCDRPELLCKWSSSVRWGVLSSVGRLGFWAPSRRIVEILREHLGDVFKNVLVERNVVDLADFNGAGEVRPSGRTRFLYVGKVTEAKGVAFLLECISGLPKDIDLELDVLGSGDIEARLRLLHAGDARIRFHGVCGRADVIRHYRSASFLLVPSLWFENSPLVIYQAQAAGLPVVGSDSGGIPELLEGRGDSLVLRSGDRHAWTSCLSALATDRERAAKMKAGAMALAREGGSEVDARGRKVVELCRSLIARRGT
jgi:glycosyltransferase involved in cell wall biosynthesis